MKKATAAQKKKAISNLAKAFGEYNYVSRFDYETRVYRRNKLDKMVIKAINTFDAFDEYEEALMKYQRKDVRENK